MWKPMPTWINLHALGDELLHLPTRLMNILGLILSRWELLHRLISILVVPRAPMLDNDIVVHVRWINHLHFVHSLDAMREPVMVKLLQPFEDTRFFFKVIWHIHF